MSTSGEKRHRSERRCAHVNSGPPTSGASVKTSHVIGKNKAAVGVVGNHRERRRKYVSEGSGEG